METLAKVVVSSEVKERTLEILAMEWLSLGIQYAPISHVMADIDKWRNMSFCRKKKDWLYRNTLWSVMQLIRNQTNKEKEKELWKRLYEECEDAKEMCCEGHISRLCNVMVGFDDAFQPPVSLGELLQNAMAKIANEDKSVEEKINEATKVMEELKVPREERGVWLEAF
jgi:hypothetical protein